MKLIFGALIALGVQLTPELPPPCIKQEMGEVLNRLARRRRASIARRA